MRHFLKDDDLTSDEQREVLAQAISMKANRFEQRPLKGPQTVALIFDKPSLRTQLSFSVGVAELGGSPYFLDTNLAQIGEREPISDVAKVLTRQVSGIVWRTHGQDRLEEMAANATVPVINALSDDYHPCQILADLQTIGEHTGGIAKSGPALAGKVFAYVGDGSNNMAHSYLLGGALAGMDVRIATPEGFTPDPNILARAEEIAASTGGSVTVTGDPVAAVSGADAVATDTWVSMGDEDEAAERQTPFIPFRLDSELLSHAPDALVMHCLPAYRGNEITAEVIDGDNSVVWDEAENRLHAQKAIMAFLLDQ